MGPIKPKTLADLKYELQIASEQDLNYILGRYGGPHNVLMRSRSYEYEAAKRLTDLVQREIASRAIETMLTDQLLSSDT